MHGRHRGFTLIELLIVIAIIGILAAIAIPNLLNAIQRGKQKRTMADIRTLATAVEAYNVDNHVYPQASCPGGAFTAAPTQLTSTTNFSSLAPTYLAQPPVYDGWRNFLWYNVSPDGQQYSIWSGGKDGGVSPPTCGTTTDFGAEIIYSNGTFIQWPEGTQN